MAVVPVVLVAAKIAEDLSARFASRHDDELIANLMSADCGGLSKMTEAVEGCFRKYVRNAICRSTESLSYIPLRYRFQECFSNRQMHSCSDWSIEDTCRNADIIMFVDQLERERLLRKLTDKDCGGLSTMPPNIEGCFRKYAWGAVDHSHRDDNYLTFLERFQECFASRPELPCHDWPNPIDLLMHFFTHL